MTDERDEGLGKRLASLPTPDHAPGFWDAIDQRLAEETVDELAEARARRHPRRWSVIVPIMTAAAIVAGVLAFASTRPTDGEGDRVDTTPATDPRVDRVPQMVTGDVVVSEAGEPEPSQEFAFARAIDGSYAMRNTATGESIAYDAESGRSISWFTFEGETTASIDTDVAPGAPDRYPSSFISGHDLEDFVVATAREGRDSIDEHDVAGRAAWRYRGPVAENKLAGSGVDFIEASVDQETGVLLRLIEQSDGAIGRQLTVTHFVPAGEIDRSAFTPEPPAGSTVETEDAGFRRSSIEELPTSGAIPALDPSPPEPFELDGLWVNVEGGGVTGPEGSNPPSKRVASLVYRDGWRRVIVTLRELGGPPARWSDPFRGEGQIFDGTSEITLEADGAFAGAEGFVVVDPQTVPHVWAVSCGSDCTAENDWPGYVLTVAGAATSDELEDFASVARAA